MWVQSPTQEVGAWGPCSPTAAEVDRDLVLAQDQVHTRDCCRQNPGPSLRGSRSAWPRQESQRLQGQHQCGSEAGRALLGPRLWGFLESFAGSLPAARNLLSRPDSPAGHPEHDRCHFLPPGSRSPSRHPGPTRSVRRDSQIAEAGPRARGRGRVLPATVTPGHWRTKLRHVPAEALRPAHSSAVAFPLGGPAPSTEA